MFQFSIEFMWIKSQHFEVGFTEEIVETMEWDNHNPNIQLGKLDKIGNIPENQASFISQNPLTIRALNQ